ncbi:hypothetical protein MTP99_013644 [Tenebrio molitor]|jgi:hypothetical protein|nr:hypothetical protein MTP99_013644 [Tenebrio molitor]
MLVFFRWVRFKRGSSCPDFTDHFGHWSPSEILEEGAILALEALKSGDVDASTRHKPEDVDADEAMNCVRSGRFSQVLAGSRNEDHAELAFKKDAIH